MAGGRTPHFKLTKARYFTDGVDTMKKYGWGVAEYIPSDDQQKHDQANSRTRLAHAFITNKE
jgi:hypothetical protein